LQGAPTISSRRRRRNPITKIELKITLIKEQERRESTDTSSQPPRGGAEMVFRSREPTEVIAKAREALVSMGKVASPPKAFKHSRKKLVRH